MYTGADAIGVGQEVCVANEGGCLLGGESATCMRDPRATQRTVSDSQPSRLCAPLHGSFQGVWDNATCDTHGNDRQLETAEQCQARRMVQITAGIPAR